MTMPARPRRDGGRHRRGVALVGLVVLALGAPALPTVAQSPRPDQEPDASAAALPDLPRATSVQGTSRLVGQLDPGVTSVEGGVLRTRANVLATEERASDPRVSGRALIWLDIDAFADASGSPRGFQVRYGRMRLVNPDGAWEGHFSGRLNEAGFSQTYWLEGEGAYEGLTYVVTAGGSGPLWVSSGLIYPGAPPADIPPGLLEPPLPVPPPLARN